MTQPSSSLCNGELTEFTLKDQASGKELKGTVRLDYGTLFFMFEGYGDYDSQDGHGQPLVIEVYDDSLRVILYEDINWEDPVIYNLDGALESKRKEDWEG